MLNIWLITIHKIPFNLIFLMKSKSIKNLKKLTQKGNWSWWYSSKACKAGFTSTRSYYYQGGQLWHYHIQFLKMANVSPVYKKNDNMSKGNYRPVSVLPTMSKIFESILADQLSTFLETVYNPFTAAFRKHHSCQSILIKIIEDWKQALVQNKYVGAILMDLSKAFDCLPHNLLLAKLKAYGLTDHSINLLRNYQTESKGLRLVITVVSGKTSPKVYPRDLYSAQFYSTFS